MAYVIALNTALEFDTADGSHPAGIMIDANHFLLAWSGAGDDGFAQVLTVNTSTWAVTTANDGIEYNTQLSQHHAWVKIDNTHFFLAYQGFGGDGFVQVFTVNTTTWAVTTSSANLEHNTSDNAYNSAVMIDANHVLVTYAGVNLDGFAQVFTVNTTTWAVTTSSSQFEFDALQGTFNSLNVIDANHFINFWAGDGGDGYVGVLAVNTTTWAVTTASSVLEFDTADAGPNMSFAIDSNHFINIWQGTSAARAQVFVVNTSTWAVTTAGAVLDFDTSYIYPAGFAQIDSNKFLANVRNNTSNYTRHQVLVVNTSTWAVTTDGSTTTESTVELQYTQQSLIMVDSSHFVWSYADSSSADGFVRTGSVNAPPTVALGTNVVDEATITDTTPSFEFTGTDAESNDVTYNIQIDTVNTFGAVVCYFDASDSSISDPQSVWSDDSNAFDGNPETYAAVTAGAWGDDSLNYLTAGGTNAPSSIGTITDVYVSTESDLTTPGSSHVSLSAPTGGWTLDKIQALSVRIAYFDDTFDRMRAYVYSAAELLGNSNTVNVSGTISKVRLLVLYTPLINHTSDVQTTAFVRTADSDPFTSGQEVTYTVPNDDALSADTYYWRVAAKDPSGTNAYGAWSSTRSFTLSGAATNILQNVITNA